MELKKPSPLGEKKTNGHSATSNIINNSISKPFLKTYFPKIFGDRFNGYFQNIKLYVSTHKERVINISLIAIPLLILAIVFIVILSYTRSHPYRLAESFIELIEIKDVANAYELTSDAYKAVTTEKQFKKVVDNLNTVDISNRKIKSKRIETLKDIGQYAYIRYKVSGSYLDLVIYNDTLDWSVHSIQLSPIK